MKSIRLCVAALAALTTLISTQALAQASTCSQTCSKSFTSCTSGGGDQAVCMKAWNQCRNSCSAPKPAAQSAAPTRVSAPVAKPAPR